jgi:hypothetical protein
MATTNPQQQQLSLPQRPGDRVYVLHFEPAYKHARHYIGWTSGTDVTARLRVHLKDRGSPLVRAAVAAGVDVQLAATYQGARYRERRLGTPVAASAMSSRSAISIRSMPEFYHT